MEEVFARLSQKIGIPVFAVLLVVVAALVNRLAPQHRHRIKRGVVVFGAFVVFLVIHEILVVAGAPIWAARFKVWSDLFSAFVVVHLFALTVFDVLLPLVGVAAVALTSDLVVAAGYVISTVGVLRGAGLDLSSVVTTSAVVSGVLALSLQTTLGNVIGGVALQLDGSIHVGDWIQLENGKQGKVREIRWRHTVIETRDWDTLIVPNASLLESTIQILGKRDGRAGPHRMWVYFNVDFRYAPSHVIDVVRDAICSAPIERVADDPKPSVICYDLAAQGKDSFAYYAVRYWLTDLAVDDPTSSVVRARIHAALARANIPLAHPLSTQFLQLRDQDADDRLSKRHRTARMVALRSVELFAALTDEECNELADHLCHAPYTAGETITHQGAVAHWLYILTKGSVDIQLSVDGETRHVATTESPGFFGEMGLMTGEARTASVIAKTDSECYRLDKSGFEEILKRRPLIAKQMSGLLAARRVGIIGVRENLGEEAKKERRVSEEARILGHIRDFFGLSAESERPS